MEIAANYKCPLCQKQMDRDLVLFLDHTNQHIIDRIKVSHPEWVAENGICEPCVKYYKGQLSGEIQNIGPAGRGARALMGIFFLSLSAVTGFYLVTGPAPRLLRLGLFVPLFLGLFGLIQAQQKTCSVLAELGSVAALKTKGRKIILCSALIAAALSLALFLLPS